MGKIQPKGGGDPIERGGVAILERTAPPSRKARASAGGSRPPRKPPAGEVAAAEPEKSKGYALLVRGLPAAMRDRLDRTRAKRGLRSVNDTILELLDEGALK